METVTLRLSDGSTIQTPLGTPAADIICHFKEKPNTIVAVRFNNEICSLTQPLENS